MKTYNKENRNNPSCWPFADGNKVTVIRVMDAIVAIIDSKEYALNEIAKTWLELPCINITQGNRYALGLYIIDAVGSQFAISNPLVLKEATK